MTALQLVGGIIYLLMGGDLLVRGAISLARRLRVSPLIVAFTVVAFGTSLPELVVGLRAASTGLGDIAFGNVVGSNIANVFLVLGAAAVVHPLTTSDRSARRDGLVMIAASVLLVVLGWGGVVRRPAGLLLLGCLLVLTAASARRAMRTRTEEDLTTPVEWVLGMPSSLGMIGLFLVAGLLGLPLGAKMVIDASVDLAGALGVSNTVIGLTLVAISTSLPELATTLVAALRKRTELVLGTVVGSNLFNVLGIMGASALVSPEPIVVSARAASLDLPVMVAAALILVVAVWRGKPLGRRKGVMLLTAYAVYLWSFV